MQDNQEKENLSFTEKAKAYLTRWTKIIAKRWWVVLVELLVLGAVLSCDLLTKKYLVEFLERQDGLFYELIPNFINLQYTENTGAGFGMFKGNTVALSAITIIVVFGLLVYLLFSLNDGKKDKGISWSLRISLVFICGGGIGNIVDRLMLGYVRDFIQFAFWEDFAIFNVADSFVVIGAFMLIVVLIVILVKEGNKNKKEFEKEKAAVGNSQDVQDPLDAPVQLNKPLSNDSVDFGLLRSGKDGDGQSKADGGKDGEELH